MFFVLKRRKKNTRLHAMYLLVSYVNECMQFHFYRMSLYCQPQIHDYTKWITRKFMLVLQSYTEYSSIKRKWYSDDDSDTCNLCVQWYFIWVLKVGILFSVQADIFGQSAADNTSTLVISILSVFTFWEEDPWVLLLIINCVSFTNLTLGGDDYNFEIYN